MVEFRLINIAHSPKCIFGLELGGGAEIGLERTGDTRRL
jgi:hypothetical protein